MAGEPNGSSQEDNITSTTTPISITTTSTTANPQEYYKTYDVMTGIRIAATLGSFFGLMVLLVLYKSKSKTEKALEDPNFTAAAVAEAEEEERQIQLAIEAIAYEQLNPNPRRTSRKSLDISSGSHGRRTSRRFSSVAAYSSLEPSLKTSPRLPCFIDEDSPPEDAGSLYEDVYYNSKLDVPRRASNITCSSSGSSYLERRDSAVTLGLPVALPAHKFKSSSRRQSSPVPEIYDFCYPIDIQVTQPTPGGSPCGSDRALYERGATPRNQQQPNLEPRLAPLASISSCNRTDCEANCEGISYMCDSLPDEEENTENGVDPFDTDSDINSDDGACYDKRTTVCIVSGDTSPTISIDPYKRHSVDEAVPSTSKAHHNRNSKSSSTLYDGCQIPQISMAEVHKLSASSSKIYRKSSWAQETLF